MTVKILGHRGNGRTSLTPFAEGKAPEHTLSSFRQAADLGADGVEFDVFLSRDGIPMILDNNEIFGHAVSDLSAIEIKSFELAQGHTIPTLQEGLLTLAEIGATRNEFAINIELKGPSVVEPTLRVVNHLAEEHQLKRHDIHYSSFDRDKLNLVRKFDPNANIQPTIATVHLFDRRHVQMPGYHVPAHIEYNKAALGDLENYIHQKRCSAIDTPTGDIRPELIDVATRQAVGFCTHPTGPRRMESVSDILNAFSLIDSFANQTSQNVFFKVDDIPEARQIVEDQKVGRPIAIDRIERVMGMRLLT